MQCPICGETVTLLLGPGFHARCPDCHKLTIAECHQKLLGRFEQMMYSYRSIVNLAYKSRDLGLIEECQQQMAELELWRSSFEEP